MTERTVVLHNATRITIPVEFWNYYVDLGLLIVYRRWPKLAFLRHDLKAKADRTNGGLRFWVKKLEPVEPRAQQSSLSSFYEPGGVMYSQYDRLQIAYRARRESVTAEKKKAQAWQKILDTTSALEVGG